jgi:hypothetical protein
VVVRLVGNRVWGGVERDVVARLDLADSHEHATGGAHETNGGEGLATAPAATATNQQQSPI